MKVLFINTYDDPAESGGGAEVTIRNLRYGLQREGVDTVMACTGRIPGLQQAEEGGLRSWRVGLRNVYWPEQAEHRATWKRLLWHAFDRSNPLMQGALRRILEVERPDVVSAHNLAGWSAMAWQTVRKAGIPLVQVLHDHYLICPKTTMYKEGNNCAKPCAQCSVLRTGHAGTSKVVNAVVGVSNYILDRHLKLGYFAGAGLKSVIHNARHPEMLGSELTPESTEGRERVRIGFIGRLDPSKGIDELLAAFAKLAAGRAELLVAGRGAADYEALLRAKSAGLAVKYLGRVMPRDFYPAVDIVVVPSAWQEPLGMVVAEAFAFGKPVIGTHRGGIPEMITDGINGLLYKAGDTSGLVCALTRLVQDGEMRRSMGVAAKVSSSPYVDVETWVGRYRALYDAIKGID